MSKQAVLKLDGDLDQRGFQVTLEMSDGGRIIAEETGYLPAAPALAQSLVQWQHHYHQLAGVTRIVLKKITIQTGCLNQAESFRSCQQAAKDLEQHLKTWLLSEAFFKVDRQLREVLSRDEAVQIVLRAADKRLHRLPWHLWDFMERYPQAEVVLGTPALKLPHPRVANSGKTVRILAILGDHSQIDVNADRTLLQQLPQATVTFLVEPSRQEVTQHLWDQPWDILFFAGHSRTENQQGRIYLNADDSLTLEELKYGLKQAIAQGLQLAIFNSCDGLGLAYELEQLSLPQLIVMREPIPDRIAQEFLKQFLSAYSQGQSIDLATRQARERLQAWEGEFPCASWLPVVCQNPAAAPPTWQELLGKRQWIFPAVSTQLRQRFRWRLPTVPLTLLAIASLAATSLVMGLRFGGVLEPLELAALDQMMRSRPPEVLDSRLLIIDITDEDINAQRQRGEQMQRQSTSAQTRDQVFDVSLSDASLHRLLTVLLKEQPRVIALDLYRDFPVEPGQAALVDQLQMAPIITICKAEDFDDPNISTIDPPPEVPLERIGFSDFQTDEDGKLRRHLLNFYPVLGRRTTACRVDTSFVNASFSLQVASSYLKHQDITAEPLENGDLQLGNRVVRQLRSHSGGYHRLLAGGGGSQILLNYRSSTQVAEHISLSEALNNQINSEYIRDKIVLIGAIAGEKDYEADYWDTPYGTVASGNPMPGVMVHAHLISQLLSAALDQRPLLQVWATWADIVWTLAWAGVGTILIVWIDSRRLTVKSVCIQTGVAIVLGVGGLYGVCFGFLLAGSWVPLVPAGLALVVAGSAVKLGRIVQVRYSSHSSLNP